MTSAITRARAELERSDEISEAMDSLRRALPRRADSQVLLDLLEDDLREGLEAAAEVESHFADLLAVLSEDRPSPISMLEASDDQRVLERLEALIQIAGQLRRRVSKAAGKVNRGR